MEKMSLAAQHIVKRYGGVTALSDGNLEVQAGEVLAFVGANGSGKSTLSKILTGVVAPDQGQLLLNGQAVYFSSPQAARKRGIVEVYQELSLVPDMTIAENIWLGHEPLSWSGMIRQREVQRRTRALLNLFAGTIRASLQPDALVSTLAPDEQQIVEILKALSHQPRLLILDEATASLDARQVQCLFELVATWKAEGMAIIFISHRMEEIFRIADRVTILRSGVTVESVELAQTSEKQLIQMMVGDVIAGQPRRQVQDRHDMAERLRVQQLRTRILRDVTFSLYEGEILGLGGLRGQGQSDILLALFGDIPLTGSIHLGEQSVHFHHPSQAMQAGLAYVPGDRNREGLLSLRSIFENLQLPSWKRYGLFLRSGRATRDATAMAHKLNIVMSSLKAPVSSLSGGNAQKVVLGKWLLRNPQILLLDDPTKGVDVRAKEEFYQILDELRADGTSILLYSSDDEELLSLSDRILVLHDGQIEAELAGETLTKTELVAASLGTMRKEQAG